MTPRYYWTVLDFRPAPPGWRALYFDPDDLDRCSLYPLPGWLLMEERCFDEEEPDPVEDRSRKLVAAAPEEHGLVEAEGVLMVLGPEETPPSREHIEIMYENRERRAAAIRRPA